MPGGFRFTGSIIVIATAAGIALFSWGLRTSGREPVNQPSRIDGHPNLSGIWQVLNTANWDLQTHAARAGAVMQPGVHPLAPVPAAPVLALGAAGGVPGDIGVVVGEEIPYQPWAAAKKKENFEQWLDRDPELKCFLPGVPRATYLPHPFQIFQGTNKMQMVYSFANGSRTIHLDDVAPSPVDTWMGHSVGHWEGDTLVVDVTGFNGLTWFDRAGNFHSDALHVIERYTPITRDAIDYDVTIEDPKVFTRPWRIRMPLYRRLEENAHLMEFRCIEMVEEKLYGHLRKRQLVERWEGKDMIVQITRKIPPSDMLYERYEPWDRGR